MEGNEIVKKEAVVIVSELLSAKVSVAGSVFPASVEGVTEKVLKAVIFVKALV